MEISCKCIKKGEPKNKARIVSMCVHGENRLVLGYNSGVVSVLSLDDATETILGEHPASINKIMIDSGIIYTSCNSGKICLWELGQDGCKNEISLPSGKQPILDFAVYGKTVITSPHGNCSIYCYSLEENGVVSESKETFIHSQSLALVSDNLVYLGYKWNVAAIDLQSNEVENLMQSFKAKLMQFNEDSIVACIGHYKKHKKEWYIVEISRDNMILSQRRIQKDFIKPGKYNRPVCGIHQFMNYWVLSTACGIALYRQNSNEPGKLIVLDEMEADITSLAIDGDRIYCACEGGAIYVVENIQSRLVTAERGEVVSDEVCLL